MLVPDLRNRYQGIFEVGNIPDVGESEAMNLPAAVLGEDRHVPDRGATRFLAVGDVKILDTGTDICEQVDIVGTGGGASRVDGCTEYW